MTNKLDYFSKVFKKVDGFKVLKQYLSARVLLFAIFQILTQGTSKKSLEIVRNSVDNKILAKLRKKYKKFIRENKEKISQNSINREHSNKVWFLWLQGIEQAPDIVKICYSSVQKNLGDRELIFLTDENYRDYILFPDYIQKKIDSGIITKTHMSDLLRLELLTRYGGTWIDATVYLSSSNIPHYMLDSDLFLFQKLKPALDGNPKSISSWYITSCTKNPILVLAKELLYEYWKKEIRLIDYFLMHNFIELAIETYPSEWKKVVPFSSSTPHILLLRLFDEYDRVIWDSVMSQTSIHKLTYKFKDDQNNNYNKFFNKVVGVE
ncbi:capsular polysaccharide synthesis protein [Lactococcus lactis]|uniref:capsular polysaccharide synthesis protein n=1 Tax=Lactococcus lactis TaxID=1358 RepID=UPI002890AC64|nr:capsular polysaccharide synthesis protein [Lactococcus lactis]MDT2905195.1 capsular polysaccharide synthesis protein [Lactococcus lactis]